MTPGVQRYRTARALAEACAAHGTKHPATDAAYARAVCAWGAARLPAIVVGDARAYVVAVLRASGTAGAGNRHRRSRDRHR